MARKLETVRDFWKWAVSEFSKAPLHYGHGTDNPQDEALGLIVHVLGGSYPFDEAKYFKKTLTLSQQEALKALVHKRVQARIPNPYLTHTAWFAGLPFYVDERVLIPRSSIAELILTEFSPWIAKKQVKKILDLGTGSGCIALACSHVFPKAAIIASDISRDALAVATQNIQTHGLTQRVKLIQSDLFSALSKTDRFDIIVSNPPYVDQKDLAALPAEYQHEPILALAGGADGLQFIDQILWQAKHYLHPQGILVVEVGNSERALCKKYPKVPFFWPDFERSEGGVFILTYEALMTYF